MFVIFVADPIGEPPVVGLVGPSLLPVSQPSVPVTTAEDKTTPKEIIPKDIVPPIQGTAPVAPGPLTPLVQTTLSPTKPTSSDVPGQFAMATSGITTTLSSAVPSKPEPAKVEVSTEDVLKNAMPSLIVPGISGSSAMNVVQKVSAGGVPTAQGNVAEAQNASESQKMQQELIEKQRLEQQKLLQKQQSQEMMLKRQQEVQIRLQEQEHQKLMQKHQELQKLQEKHKQLQEQQKLHEKEKEQQQQEAARQKQIEEQHKHLQQQMQQHFETFQRPPGVNKGLPPMLSPGALRPQRPGLPSPGANGGPRPPISAHHQMPPGAPFGLPGQHPGAIPIHPGHLSPGQLPLPQHMIPGMGPEKPPASAAAAAQNLQHQLFTKAQQAQMQKVQAQYLAEQQAQNAKQQAQQAQAAMKQQAQQNQTQQPHSQAGKQPGPAPPPQIGPGPPVPPQQGTPGKKGQEQGVSLYLYSELQISGGIEDNSKIIFFLFLRGNFCCDPSLELSR